MTPGTWTRDTTSRQPQCTTVRKGGRDGRKAGSWLLSYLRLHDHGSGRDVLPLRTQGLRLPQAGPPAQAPATEDRASVWPEPVPEVRDGTGDIPGEAQARVPRLRDPIRLKRCEAHPNFPKTSPLSAQDAGATGVSEKSFGPAHRTQAPGEFLKTPAVCAQEDPVSEFRRTSVVWGQGSWSPGVSRKPGARAHTWAGLPRFLGTWALCRVSWAV